MEDGVNALCIFRKHQQTLLRMACYNGFRVWLQYREMRPLLLQTGAEPQRADGSGGHTPQNAEPTGVGSQAARVSIQFNSIQSSSIQFNSIQFS